MDFFVQTHKQVTRQMLLGKGSMKTTQHIQNMRSYMQSLAHDSILHQLNIGKVIHNKYKLL